MTLAELIADNFGISEEELMKVVRTASHRYKTFTIPKRTGGVRVIHHPSRELKSVQRWIKLRILDRLEVHRCAMAYRPKVSTRDHALAHIGGRFLLRLDFRDFFPSLTRADVERCLLDRLNEIAAALGQTIFPQDLALITNIVCRKDRLTIGAPTSPGLSNILMYDLDSFLSGYCERRGVVYTRYADDLFFSTTAPGVIASIPDVVGRSLRSIGVPTGLSINDEKTLHTSRKGRMSVTGLVLTPDGAVSIGRERKRIIRAMIWRLDKLDAANRNALAGWLGYCRSVEPQFINRLIQRYGLPIIVSAQKGTPAPWQPASVTGPAE